jgi:hypothetical protein
MKINKIIKSTKTFFKKTQDSIKTKKQIELDELKKIEEKLKILEQEENNIKDHLIWNNKTMFRFWGIAILMVFIVYI